MDELVAKRILFDLEVILLIALVIGIVIHGVLGSFRKEPTPGIGAKFGKADLLLIWFPLIFFLINPILSYFLPDMGSATPEVPKDAGRQLVEGLNQFVSFAFIGVITVILIQLVTLRDAVEMLGLRQSRLPVIVAYGLAGTVVSLFVCNQYLGNLSSEFLREKLGNLDIQRPVEEMKNAKAIPVVLLSVINAVIIAPIVEETLFRGYFYGVMKRFSSPLFSALITGGLFAVVHSNLLALLPLWVFAIILTLSYEMSRCLWVPILIHSLFNGVNVAFLFLSKGE